MGNRKVIVSVVQATPHFFNNDKSLTKMRSLLSQCANEGSKLVLFPESFLPGYPRGMTFGATVGSRSEAGRELWKKYWENSLTVGDEYYMQLSSLAKEFDLFLIVGITERATTSRSLYCSLLYFDRTGNLIGKHRKIKPTGTERVIWAEGSGESLITYSTTCGRLGGLICWENLMPEARLALYRSGLDIYLAPTADARNSWSASMQHISCEGRCFVLSANQYFSKSDYTAEWRPYLDADLSEDICRGGSLIVSPYGEILAGPLFDAEGILTVEIDLDEIIRSRMDFDPIGHYTRPDLFEFNLKKGKHRYARTK